MKRLLLLCLFAFLGLPVAVAAPAWLEVSDGGQYVSVLAKGVECKSFRVKTSKQYLLIELEGVTLKKERFTVSDKTVSKLEAVGGQSSSRLYIEIKKDAPTPLQLVPLVRVEPVAEGLRIMFPRAIEAAVAPVISPVVSAAPTPAPLPESLQPKPAPATQPVPVVVSSEKKEPAAALPPIIIQNSGNSVSTWFLVVLVLGGIAAAVWLKKKQLGSPEESRIKVLASHALDGKNKLVLLTAGKKELLLSVSDGGTRLLERWKREEPEGSYEKELQEAQASEFQFESPDRVEFAKTVRQEPPIQKVSNEYWRMEDMPKPEALRSVPKPALVAAPTSGASSKGDDTQSAAVAGILRLRKKQTSEESQDDEWTRELLAMAGKNSLSS